MDQTRSTRSRLVSAAWELFYERGYEQTTVDEIVARSGTSKGSFYHYFPGKEALLSSLSVLFDEKYALLSARENAETGCFERLMQLNRELFFMIENTVPLELLAKLLASQLSGGSEKHLLDQSRLYFRLLRQICMEGQRRGELRGDIPVGEMVRAYALQERALMYDWCLCGGTYSLSQFAAVQLPRYLAYLLPDGGRMSAKEG